MASAKLPQARLQHILEQIDGITAATQGLAFAQVDDNFLYERAVERAVQIISEAAKELPLELRNKYPDVHWQPIIAIGFATARILPDQAARHVGNRDSPSARPAPSHRENDCGSR